MFTTLFTALALAALLAGMLGGGPAAPAPTHPVSGSVSAFDGTQGGPPGVLATP